MSFSVYCNGGVKDVKSFNGWGEAAVDYVVEVRVIGVEE